MSFSNVLCHNTVTFCHIKILSGRFYVLSEMRHSDWSIIFLKTNLSLALMAGKFNLTARILFKVGHREIWHEFVKYCHQSIFSRWMQNQVFCASMPLIQFWIITWLISTNQNSATCLWKWAEIESKSILSKCKKIPTLASSQNGNATKIFYHQLF